MDHPTPISTYVSIHLSIYLSIYLSISISIHVYIHIKRGHPVQAKANSKHLVLPVVVVDVRVSYDEVLDAPLPVTHMHLLSSGHNWVQDPRFMVQGCIFCQVMNDETTRLRHELYPLSSVLGTCKTVRTRVWPRPSLTFTCFHPDVYLIVELVLIRIITPIGQLRSHGAALERSRRMINSH